MRNTISAVRTYTEMLTIEPRRTSMARGQNFPRCFSLPRSLWCLLSSNGGCMGLQLQERLRIYRWMEVWGDVCRVHAQRPARRCDVGVRSSDSDGSSNFVRGSNAKQYFRLLLRPLPHIGQISVGGAIFAAIFADGWALEGCVRGRTGVSGSCI